MSLNVNGTGIENVLVNGVAVNNVLVNGTEIWRRSYTVTFNGHSTRSVLHGYAVGTLPTLSKSGYEFRGWTDAAGNFINANTVITANTTFYPSWYTIGVIFNDEIGAVKWNNTTLYTNNTGGTIRVYCKIRANSTLTSSYTTSISLAVNGGTNAFLTSWVTDNSTATTYIDLAPGSYINLLQDNAGGLVYLYWLY